MINKIYSTLALFLFSGLVNAFTVYTDKTDWENALSGAVVITENFEDQTMADGLASYTIPQGTFTELQSFNLVPSTNLDGQAFQDIVGSGTPPRSVVWNFSSPFIAFGGNWDLSPASLGTGLEIKINGIIQTPNISTSHVDGGFWGVVAEDVDLPFLMVEVLRPITESSGTEVYHLDDMVFASAVPLPAAIWLFGSGFIGLFGHKKYFSHQIKKS